MSVECEGVRISHLNENCWYFEVVRKKKVRVKKNLYKEVEVKLKVDRTIALDDIVDRIVNIDVDKGGKLVGVEIVL